MAGKGNDMQPLDIAIVGCGTSGLAAALFLTHRGHKVTLLERFDTPRPLGAGLLLQPTGLACLAALGLDDAVIEMGAKIHNLYGRTAKGRVIFDITYRDLHPNRFGLGIHRGALFGALYDAVQAQGIRIVTNAAIADTGIEGDKRILHDASGTDYGAFDLVIDASGAQSTLREKYGDIKYNKPYPYGAVWGVCEDAGQVFGKDYLQQRYDGAGVMIGALAIGKRPEDQKDTLAFFWSLPAHAYADWRAAGMDVWRQRVTDYWPGIQPFTDQFKTADDLTFAKYSDVIMRKWHGDRLVFIGDAAHSTSPQLGQGANLGLVDALMLADVLQAADINGSLAAYSAARKKHTHFYQVASRWLTPFFQSDSRPAAFVRDMTFGLMCKMPYVKTQMLQTLGGVKTGLFTHLNPGQWHVRYDVRKSQP